MTRKHITKQLGLPSKIEGISAGPLPTRVLYVGDLKHSGYTSDFVRLVCASETSSVLYLWIDSLCIIQYRDNGEDWKRESGQMESVFLHAYCTITATTADVNPRYVYVQDASGKQFYISADIDDFDNDVGKAQLNTRAWVFANQTYWECRKGVYCILLLSPYRDKYFTLDLDFLRWLLNQGKRLLTDRCIAISRLEDRIAGALKCQSRYGIFQKYLHRNLLWQVSNDKMKEIAYDHHVLSWSWMAYSGGIQFMDIPLGETFQNCKMGLYEAQYAVLDSDGAKRGWIQYDVEGGKDLRKEQYVVVGRKSNSGIEEYYVLVVRPTGVDGEYRRVGVGLIQSDCVVGQRINVRVV
ncbi:hypothetical protein K469DRAFT_724384 [Zopfia rhizophila CBS 207.26]|uniref:Heterokaryon incompatibility domain-containing protein n=1 Tax=Zopfia rhizophila CBS 207.26 TaxID=1314779 RepID=A0A6A6D740_9PEZI|nr:hypothetical protein K469DRAFT_724384 [Zopfia rhizophila CBS 207.26]